MTRINTNSSQDPFFARLRKANTSFLPDKVALWINSARIQQLFCTHTLFMPTHSTQRKRKVRMQAAAYFSDHFQRFKKNENFDTPDKLTNRLERAYNQLDQSYKEKIQEAVKFVPYKELEAVANNQELDNPKTERSAYNILAFRRYLVQLTVGIIINELKAGRLVFNEQANWIELIDWASKKLHGNDKSINIAFALSVVNEAKKQIDHLIYDAAHTFAKKSTPDYHKIEELKVQLASATFLGQTSRQQELQKQLCKTKQSTGYNKRVETLLQWRKEMGKFANRLKNEKNTFDQLGHAVVNYRQRVDTPETPAKPTVASAERAPHLTTPRSEHIPTPDREELDRIDLLTGDAFNLEGSGRTTPTLDDMVQALDASMSVSVIARNALNPASSANTFPPPHLAQAASTPSLDQQIEHAKDNVKKDFPRGSSYSAPGQLPFETTDQLFAFVEEQFENKADQLVVLDSLFQVNGTRRAERLLVSVGFIPFSTSTSNESKASLRNFVIDPQNQSISINYQHEIIDPEEAGKSDSIHALIEIFIPINKPDDARVEIKDFNTHKLLLNGIVSRQECEQIKIQTNNLTRAADAPAKPSLFRRVGRAVRAFFAKAPQTATSPAINRGVLRREFTSARSPQESFDELHQSYKKAWKEAAAALQKDSPTSPLSSEVIVELDDDDDINANIPSPAFSIENGDVQVTIPD